MGVEHANHVPGAGPLPCDWCVVGEGPGWQENKAGRPFVGETGDEMRRFFDGIDLPAFADVFRTNLYRLYGGKDYVWTDEDFARDEPRLLEELQRCQPKVIVAVGRFAARYFMGDVDMEGVHGLPWHLPHAARAAAVFDGLPPVVFPTYHPAAGMRNPEMAALVADDFSSLALFAAGELQARTYGDDPYPKPQYFHVTNPDVVKSFAPAGEQEVCEDSEGSARRPWSLQWSRAPGTGYMLRANAQECVAAYLDWITRNKVKATFHSALHDRPVRRAFARALGWSEEDILFKLDLLPFDDTRVMAYLLQVEPQGLKPLALRHANMPMQSYTEVIGDAQDRLAIDWLVGTWQVLDAEYREAQEQEQARINSTPLRDKWGKVRRNKDGSIRRRKTSRLPTLPKSRLFRSVERCIRSKRPYGLWTDQADDILVDGFNFNGPVPEASLSHVDFETALYYGCRDADATHRVKKELLPRLRRMGLTETYALEISTYPLIDRMGAVGMLPDLKVFSALSKRLENELADLQCTLDTQTGIENFNANSGDQVDDLVHNTYGVEPLKWTRGSDKKEARGSTNDDILEVYEREFGHDYPAIITIRQFRQFFKLKNTFVDRVPYYVHRWPYDGRVHATFRTTSVVSGRLSASDPNLLAMPEHGKFAGDFKAGWVASPGHVVCNWDLSQIELRVLADLSQDPVLLEAYLFKCAHERDWQLGKTICKRDACVLKGDLHARLAHMVFGLQPSQQDDHNHRYPAKTHNFGLAMGMTCHGLMIQLRKNGVDVDESGAQEWIDASNKLYARVLVYKAEKIAEAKRHGFVRDLGGRIRYIGGIRNKDERVRAEAERFAFGTPIQSSAQKVMKQAEAYIWQNLLVSKYYRQGYFKGSSRGQWVEPLCQVHDALKFEVVEGLQEQLDIEMTHAMTKVPTQLSVPLGVEGKWGYNFASMEKFKRTT